MQKTSYQETEKVGRKMFKTSRCALSPPSRALVYSSCAVFLGLSLEVIGLCVEVRVEGCGLRVEG
eukprot:2957989-Rhodomonas_salina.3